MTISPCSLSTLQEENKKGNNQNQKGGRELELGGHEEEAVNPRRKSQAARDFGQREENGDSERGRGGGVEVGR